MEYNKNQIIIAIFTSFLTFGIILGLMIRDGANFIGSLFAGYGAACFMSAIVKGFQKAYKKGGNDDKI
jgi:hypothetical protein